MFDGIISFSKIKFRPPTFRFGPACLVEESSAAKKTHGDRTMADALTIEDKYYKMRTKQTTSEARNDMRTPAGRRATLKQRRAKPKGWRSKFDFRK